MPIGHLFRSFKRDRSNIQKYADNNTEKKLVGDKNSFEGLFWNHKGKIVHKWQHYLPIYEKFLKKYKNEPIKFLEIGVAEGGSLSLWRKYFGANATIFGVDIDPRCSCTTEWMPK